MADVLLMPVGSHGDVHPYVALGRTLQARGHQVTMITSAYFERMAARAGLPFIGLGTVEDYLACADHPDLWRPPRAFQVVAQMGILPWMRASYQMIAERYVPGRTVVVSSVLGFGARIAREKLGVPLLSLHLQPAVLFSSQSPPELPLTLGRPWFPTWGKRLLYWLGFRFLIDPAVGPATNAFRAELGLPPVSGFLRTWAHSPDGGVGLFPDWFCPPEKDWPPGVTLSSFPLFDEAGMTQANPEAEAFLSSGEPPIVFTPGSAMKQGHAFFSAAADACQRLGKRGMLLTRFTDHLPPRLPEGVRHFEYVPFSQVFRRAAAVVHHGGIGTLAQALAAGAPHLVMPMAHDQPDNASRLMRLGVGAALRPSAFRGPAVARELKKLLGSPRVAARCAGLARRLEGADPLGPVCERVERLAR
jgi:UDP:flavonoid glycosyltransferase YjiC (YdhE family)